jgi:hypothetical protein
LQPEEKRDVLSKSKLAATAEVTGGGVALLVGVGGRLSVICTGAAIDAGLRCVAVARTEDACARMVETKPRVVLVPGGLDRAEIDALAIEARAHGAVLVALPSVVGYDVIAHEIARALAVGNGRDDDAPETVRADSPSGVRLRT